MKNKIITEIKTSMAPLLSTKQLQELGRVLANSLYNVDLVPKSSVTLNQEKESGDLLDSFIASKHVEGCSNSSLIYYNTTIKQLLDSIEKPVCEITTDDLRGYLANYQKERNSSRITIDNIRRIFSSFFGWLEDEDYIIKSPVRRIHKIKTEKQVKDTFTDENLEILRDSCTELRDLAMIDILTSTGMRVGELVKLNKEDIDFQERECVVLGKGSSERIAYFDARTKIHIKNYLDSRKDNNPALFVTLCRPNNRLQIGGVETRLRNIGIMANLQKVHPHKFRRSLATRAIDKGMPIEQVQKLLGHVKIDTTMHYAMVNQTNVKNSHRKYIG